MGLFVQGSNPSLFLATHIRPAISEEQKAFILRVTEIPLEERRCRDLITPNALHAYCGGPAPTEEARRLNNLSRQRKLHESFHFRHSYLGIFTFGVCLAEMESAKLRAQIRAAAAPKKEEGKGKEGASTSLPKAVDKGAAKRKGDGAGGRLAKKQTVTLGDHSTKPPSPKHGAGKGLMSAQGPVTQEDGRCLLTHKGYALERLDSILGKEDADSCVNQSVQELGDLGLFDLARVRILFIIFSLLRLLFVLMG